MDTLYSLWRESGHDPAIIGARGEVKPISSGSSWSGPGDIEQWPGVQELIYQQTGGAVTERGAMNYASVYASVRILAMIDGALPVHLFRDRPNGIGQDPVTKDYRFTLLHDRPNQEMSAPLFRLFMKQNRCLWGNAFAWIEWGPSGRADAIWPMRPDWMTVYRLKSGRKVYHYEPQDQHATRAGYYDPDEMLHFRGMGDDLVGWSPIRCARMGIELGMSAVTFGKNFFNNSARPGGILTVDKLNPKLVDDAQADFDKKYASAARAGRTLVIDGNSKFTAVTIPPNDAQYLETRQFQGGEISSKIFGVPPHLTGDTEKQSSWGTGVEQMSIGFVTYTILPDCVLQEGEIDMKLLGGGLYCKYNMHGMLRADYKAQQEGLQIQRRNGIINGDEWRATEERNPIAGGLGQIYIVEGNMTTLDKVGVDPEPAPAAAAV